MLMFSGHIVGQQMSVGGNNGFFSLLLIVILCLTGMDVIYCIHIDLSSIFLMKEKASRNVHHHEIAKPSQILCFLREEGGGGKQLALQPARGYSYVGLPLTLEPH